MDKGEIIIYQTGDGKSALEVNLREDTVWLTQKQMGVLFDKDTDTIGLHIRNIFKEGELEPRATTEESSVVQDEGGRQVRRKVKFFNLDVIISVGYRVKSLRGTQFRIWANNVLKDYLVRGYALNEKRLQEQLQRFDSLKQSIRLIENIARNKMLSITESEGLLRVITDFTYALDILDQYDYQKLQIVDTSHKDAVPISYSEAMQAIQKLRGQLSNADLFGREKDQSFRTSLDTIYQTFDGKDLYPSIEEKAAHLLYFVVKNHSFVDGNKRIAAAIFTWFMEKNGLLYSVDGMKRIADNALVALTLMIALSDPKDKDTIIKVIISLINKHN
jgi:prophage maintenance system killer protein